VTSKFNYRDLLPETISIILSALIYDEEAFTDRARDLFGFISHCFRGPSGRYFYAAVLSDSGTLWVVFRGTDGDGFIGRALSWLCTNLRISINSKGYHKGFYKIASDAMTALSWYIRSARVIYVCGHSQGGGSTVPFTAIVSRMYRSIRELTYLQADIFAGPPAVNEKGQAEMNSFISARVCKIFNWQQPGDPILAKRLRAKRGPLAGRDVGEVIQLPNMIPDHTPQDLASHSPSVYLWTYRQMVPHQTDKDAITYVLESGWIVN
jgi:hypothetical protein